MKNPKALFPFLFASSWFGNLILTLLAFYLAFTHDGPLSPLVFLTVAVCILSGNLLPITVYFILVRWEEAELKAERAEASVLVRESLRRSEQILGRLDEAEGALAKGILLARQVPERIKESFEVLEGLVDRLNTMEVASFTESLQAQSEAIQGTQAGLEAFKTNLEEMQSSLKGLRKDLRGVPDTMAELLEKAVPARGEESDDSDVPVNERLDLVYESLESVQDSLDGLLKRMAELQLANSPTRTTHPVAEVLPEAEAAEMAAVGPSESGEEAVEPEEARKEAELPDLPDDEWEDLEDSPEEDEGAEAGPADDSDFEGEVEFLEPEDLEEEAAEEAPPPPVKKAAKRAASRKTEQTEYDAQAEMPLEGAAKELPAGVSSDGLTRIIVHAMVGISNKIYIRGDEPWLSWDDGQQMELIGIGEYAWSIDDLKEPIEVMLMLNDELVAEGGSIQLEPGKTVHVSPRFPKG